jgi:hypothetical protein
MVLSGGKKRGPVPHTLERGEGLGASSGRSRRRRAAIGKTGEFWGLIGGSMAPVPCVQATDVWTPATVPRGLTIQVIQTEIEMISNKFKNVQTLFDPKRTLSNSNFFK